MKFKFQYQVMLSQPVKDCPNAVNESSELDLKPRYAT